MSPSTEAQSASADPQSPPTEVRQDPPVAGSAGPVEALAAARYTLLRSYRADGTGVDTPLWFHLDGSVLQFRSQRGPKIRRVEAHPQVDLWPCDFKGRVDDGAAGVRGRAIILEGEAAEAGNRALHRRYGWQWNVVPLLTIPGVTKGRATESWREKLRLARSRALWPGSVIVRVDLDLDLDLDQPGSPGR